MSRPFLAAALILWTYANAHAGEVQARAQVENVGDLLTARDAVETSYRKSLGELAQWCDERQLTGAGKLLRDWLPNRDSLKSYIFKLSDSFDPPTGLDG